MTFKVALKEGGIGSKPPAGKPEKPAMTDNPWFAKGLKKGKQGRKMHLLPDDREDLRAYYVGVMEGRYGLEWVKLPPEFSE